jgi:uncharacterized heparinase superfamily protein
MQNLLWICYAIVERMRRMRQRFGNRLAARLSRFSAPAKAFKSQPEPRSIGVASRGLQLTAGNFLFAGYLVEAPGTSIWSIPQPDDSFAAELHGFGWMDDLAAAGDLQARKIAQIWLQEWIATYGRGKGRGWTPELTGRRVIRWINHAVFLLRGQDTAAQQAYFRALGRQAYFLSRRWKVAPSGLPRFEALTGLAYCGLALEGKSRLLDPAIRALGRECLQQIDGAGAIATRNPEELMEIFTLLTWAAKAIGDAGRQPHREHLLALERMAPTLRALRLGDGSLIRFHGGGCGLEGRLDQSLADAGIRSPARAGGAMGYTRLASGGTILLMDSGYLPPVHMSENAHASTLAFEMSSGRQPLLVNQGPGYDFGEDWREACRATQAHNTLVAGNTSSARFAPEGFVGRTFGRRLVLAPKLVTVRTDQNEAGVAALATHTGYAMSYGLTHSRRIELVRNGAELRGEDRLEVLTGIERRRYNKGARGKRRQVLPFSAIFNVHPEVQVHLDMGGTAASLTLSSGEIWVFRVSGGKISLKPGAFMEKARLSPRATKQIVVSSRIVNYEGLITWSLTRTNTHKPRLH